MSPPSSRRVQGESAYEVARKRLELAGDRDAILDAFFEYSQELFKFSVLFVVRGEVAQGRRVHGLGAPEGLVARLVFPFSQGGILKRAWEYKRAFVASPATDGEDAALIGSLGRAMPVAVVAPVVVSGRVVAILLGEGPKRFEDEGPAVTDATLMELAKDRMFAWTDTVGDAFERLIVRRKSEDGNVVASLRRPPSSQQAPTDSFVLPEPAARKSAPRSVVGKGALAGAVGLMGVALAVGLLWPKSAPDPTAVVVPGERLTGWPSAVDPLAALDHARKAAGPIGSAELLSIRAEIGKGGTVDVPGALKRPEAVALAFTFADEASSADVRVDAEGFRGPRVEGRAQCDGRPCGRALKVPQCTFAQVWEAATKVGARDDDRLRATFSGGEAGPEWSLAIDGRGTVVLDDATCKPRSRERFRPPARPLASLPGAPSAVDPIKVLPIAREQSGLGPDSALLEIEAKGVGSDGTVDFSEADRRIVYRFSDSESLPIAERRWRQVTLDAEGMPVTSIASDRDPLPNRVHGPVALPRCTFGQVWSLGLLKKDARAKIIYGADETSTEAGQWTLEAPGLAARVTHSDLACVEPPPPSADAPREKSAPEEKKEK